MKMLFLWAMVLGLAVPQLMGQGAGGVPAAHGVTRAGGSVGDSSGLGDNLFTIDVENITGDSRCLGIEFDDLHFWATGAYDFTIAYLYEFTPDGVLVNKYPQPPAHWGGWGWRDLAFDGEYLYAGDPNTPHIQQIDPATGQVTGVQYGPFPIVPCRALCYDPTTDSFWTATFSSNLYQCFRDGTFNTYPNPGIAIYGCAIEESDPAHPMGWWVAYDSISSTAYEFDPRTGQFTGKSFLIDGAGGACAFDYGGGEWTLAVLVQGSPDQVIGYDLNTAGDRLFLDKDLLYAFTGGTAAFTLKGGLKNAHRPYALFGSLSGTSPGTMLPGGQTVLPINWDVFTNFLLDVNLPGFLGQLDGSGKADTELTIAKKTQVPGDLLMSFAFALKGPPWDFASNPVDLLVKPGGEEYQYDDGTAEGILLWMVGGDVARLHAFDAKGGSDVISGISVAWGSALVSGGCPGNGTPSTVFIWEDPNDDGDPTDGVLLAKKGTIVQNVDTDILNLVVLDTPVPVSGIFFIGCVLHYPAGQGVVGLDQDTIYGGQAWLGGNASGTFDYNNAGNNDLYEMGSLGLSGYFLLRAVR